jgi:uncharacterized membrane protein
MTFLVLSFTIIYNLRFVKFSTNKAKSNARQYFYQLIFIVICISAVMLAPGTAKRNQQFQSKGLDLSEFFQFFVNDFINGFYTILNTEGFFFMLIIGLSIGVLVKSNTDSTLLNSNNLFQINNVYYFLLALFLTLSLTSALNFLSYNATWHLIPAIIIFYLATLMTSIGVGLKISRNNSTKTFEKGKKQFNLFL